MSYLVLTVLVTLAIGLALSNVNELNYANRYRNATAAFWLAEAAISRFIEDTSMLNGGNQTISLGGGTIVLTKDDTDPTLRIVQATATVDGVSREIEVHFPSLAPGAFDNALSTGGDVVIWHHPGQLDVDDKARISGAMSASGNGTGESFEDLIEGVATGETTLTYPDADNNGTPDEFNDFVEFNQDILNNYDPNDVVYIQSDDPVSIFPNDTLIDKKIVYIEGSLPGTGNVDIYFGAAWADNQNLTIISTGSVNYVQPLEENTTNSQLNTISWDDYTEISIHRTTHSGVIFTHSMAYIYCSLGNSNTLGSLIANEGIYMDLKGVAKRFDYEDPLDANGLVPPGFEGLIGSGGGGGYSSTPIEWREI